MVKKLIILVAVTIVSCTSDKGKQINPNDNYHVEIKAYDTSHVMLHGNLTIGNSVLNIRQGFKDSILVDTFIVDDVNLGLSHNLMLSKINKNCALSQDTNGLIKIRITGTSFVYVY